MKRLQFNILIDAAALLSAALLVSTGILLAFVLPPGSGRGRLSWLGAGRHDWGEVHYYGAIIFLILIAIHLVLHWSWIKAVAWGTPNSPKPALVRCMVALGGLLIALAVFIPLLVPTERNLYVDQLEERGTGPD